MFTKTLNKGYNPTLPEWYIMLVRCTLMAGRVAKVALSFFWRFQTSRKFKSWGERLLCGSP
ncbi:hypothetical protein OSCI_3900015 [Kamptonema sp. PCC 6506]|nr:hypothetical protein OSCI_3900015 [Kamptonema sp. PCC 6506]